MLRNGMLPMPHAMSGRHKLTAKNLRKLAWINGHDGVTGLSRHVGKSRVTVWRAVRNPRRFGPTYAAIEKALPRRSNGID